MRRRSPRRETATRLSCGTNPHRCGTAAAISPGLVRRTTGMSGAAMTAPWRSRARPGAFPQAAVPSYTEMCLGLVGRRWQVRGETPSRGDTMPTRDTAWPNGTPCWIDYGAADIDAAKSFYSDVLGWSYEGGDDPQYGGYMTAQTKGRAAAGLAP